jgi:hypothetical protein
VTATDLLNFEFPPADRPIIDMLQQQSERNKQDARNGQPTRPQPKSKPEA